MGYKEEMNKMAFIADTFGDLIGLGDNKRSDAENKIENMSMEEIFQEKKKVDEKKSELTANERSLILQAFDHISKNFGFIDNGIPIMICDIKKENLVLEMLATRTAMHTKDMKLLLVDLNKQKELHKKLDI